jgi:hypothetical protein
VTLSAKKFDALAKKAFGSILEPEGFSCLESTRCTFYRQIADDLFHFVVPDQLRNLPKYDVKVFFNSPRLEPGAWEGKFPDDIGIPTDTWSSLHSTSGVGPDQQLFWCRTEEGFLKDFEGRVRPALIMHAIPYLRGYMSLTQAIPAIRSKHYRAIAATCR